MLEVLPQFYPSLDPHFEKVLHYKKLFTLQCVYLDLVTTQATVMVTDRSVIPVPQERSVKTSPTKRAQHVHHSMQTVIKF